MSLPNPEREWMRASTGSIDRDEVERRIGPTSDALELLAGGLSNLNIRVGRDRVLRIFRGLDAGTMFRDASVVGKEAALAARDWRSFRTPKLLARGPDFVVYEYVEHVPLSDAHGAAVGHALAEIHAITYPGTGFLGADLTLMRPPEWGPIEDDEFTPRDYGHSQLAEVGAVFDVELSARIAAFAEQADRALPPGDLQHFWASFELAQALWLDPSQRARARTLAETARTAFSEGQADPVTLAKIVDWLARHPG